MSDKPLFIPLKVEYFDAFRDGRKRTEYRIYGKRWNHDTCYPGRAVTLSRGYGIKARLRGRVARLNVWPVDGLEDSARTAFLACYGRADVMVAAIDIEIGGAQ
jgi:hypothetical protein